MLASIFPALPYLIPSPLWGEGKGEGKSIRKSEHGEHVRL